MLLGFPHWPVPWGRWVPEHEIVSSKQPLSSSVPEKVERGCTGAAGDAASFVVHVGRVMKLTLSCDHRTVDGVAAAKFWGELKRLLENAEELLAKD
jgi:hypothetical protein